jgi:hypothetical protein
MGGLHCCSDERRCAVEEGFVNGPKRTLYLQVMKFLPFFQDLNCMKHFSRLQFGLQFFSNPPPITSVFLQPNIHGLTLVP